MRMLKSMKGTYGTLRDLVSMFRDVNTTATAGAHTGRQTVGGEEIYRKVIAMTAFPNAGTSNYGGAAGVDDIISIGGVCRKGTVDFPVGHPTVYARRNGDNIEVTTTADYSTYTGELVIEYTKA